MPNKIGKQAKKSIQIFPPAGWREDQLSRLRKFRPHKLRAVMQEAKGSAQEKNLDAKVILAFRRRNEEQVDRLVRAMGFDPGEPNVWQRAFFKLAMLHWGVGHLTWMPPREGNRRAAKWTAEQDSAFYLLMSGLLDKGLRTSAALRQLANDPEKWKLFPQPANDRSETPPAARRFETYRKRWRKIRKSAWLAIVGSEVDKHFLEGMPPVPVGKSKPTEKPAG